jgi:hypothetical protein
VLGIGKSGKSKKDDKSNSDKEAKTPDNNKDAAQSDASLIEKMSLYLAKMALHDYELQGKKPSLQAVGAFYVGLKICEQLKQAPLITNQIISKLVAISKAKEDDIIEVS